MGLRSLGGGEARQRFHRIGLVGKELDAGATACADPTPLAQERSAGKERRLDRQHIEAGHIAGRVRAGEKKGALGSTSWREECLWAAPGSND